MKFTFIYFLLPIIIFAKTDSILVGKSISDFEISNTHKITMDVKVLKNPLYFKHKQPISIDIENDKNLTFIPVRLDKGEKEGDFSWVGHSTDGKEKVILSIHNNLIYGTINSKNAQYKLYPGNGYSNIMKVNPSMVMPYYDGEEGNGDIVSEKEKPILETPPLLPNKKNTLPDIPLQSKITQTNVSNNIVTVLIYYTQALQTKYGDNTESIIQANLDLAKNAYLDSNTSINIQIAAIKKVKEDTFLSTATPSNLNDLLNKLSVDGFVHYERELYQADIVTIFSNYPDTGTTGCGLAITPQSTSTSFISAFSAVYIKPASEGGYYCSDLSFAHELGHNFGCFHDSDHVNSGVPMYTYAYGYDVINKFGTIMSYDGPGISYFSNPTLSYTDGTPIGNTSSADNARTIRENKYGIMDNSEQISESLEGNDILLNEYNISGLLDNDSDRDGYILGLDGTTNFIVDNTNYSTNPYFVNIYNERTHTLMYSFSDHNKTLLFTRGQYRIVLSFSNDQTGEYYNLSSLDYNIDITTEYKSFFIPIISYILN